MVKYSSLLFIASMFCLTVSCSSGEPAPQTPSKALKNSQRKAFARDVRDAMVAFLTDLTDISRSSNIILKIIQDILESSIEQYDKHKKYIQVAVTKGTEMEKKIQSVSQSLKNSSIPLSKEVQAEIDAIGKRATSELKNLKGMENVKDIEGIQKEAQEKYTDIKGTFQELFHLALNMAPKEDGTININKTLPEFKTKLIVVFSKALPAALSAKKNEGTVFKKKKTTYVTLSKISSDLDRLQRIQYNSLRSCEAHSGADAAFLAHSSLALYVFAIMLGMLF